MVVDYAMVNAEIMAIVPACLPFVGVLFLTLLSYLVLVGWSDNNVAEVSLPQLKGSHHPDIRSSA